MTKKINGSVAVVAAIKKFAQAHQGRPPEQKDLGAIGISEWEIRKMGGLEKAYQAAGIEILKGPTREFLEKTRLLDSSRQEIKHLKEQLNLHQAEISDLKALPHVKSAIEVEKAKRQVQDYKKMVKEMTEDALSTARLRELLGTVDCDQLGEGGEWTKGSKKGRQKGIPVISLSDLHFDEVVRREQVGGMNEYNHEIAVGRIRTAAKNAISILKYHVDSPKYDGVVCNLMGDLLSGNIHEELAETNEQPINQSIFDLTDLLIEVIGMMADEFGKVFVPCVTGNHGRMHKKPRAKNRVKDNFEWIIYQYLSRYFKNDGRISFLIPESSDAYYAIYGFQVLSTHGDQFRGGDGVTGCLSAIMRGYAKKQSKQQAMGQPFDFMTLGHFHQLTYYKGIFINSSTKGMDEYSYQGNFGFEPPQQGMFLIHPEWGMVASWPLFCDQEAPNRSFKPVEIFSR